MGWTRTLPMSDRTRRSLSRARGLLLALAIETLVILLFLFLVPELSVKQPPKPVVFGFDTDAGEQTEAHTSDKAEKRSGGGKTRSEPQEQVVRPLPPAPPETKLPSEVIWLSRRDYSAVNEAILSQGSDSRANRDSSGSGDTDGNDSQLAGGKGPNGEPLYAAEWVSRPTGAQLAPYKPDPNLEGWGEIACRTVANYRVEDCQELADWPRGSQLAGAVRQAAWQFRVRPPRVGGKVMVGTWVRIRIDYTVIRTKS